jgi:hypothetical protein
MLEASNTQVCQVGLKLAVKAASVNQIGKSIHTIYECSGIGAARMSTLDLRRGYCCIARRSRKSPRVGYGSEPGLKCIAQTDFRKKDGETPLTLSTEMPLTANMPESSGCRYLFSRKLCEYCKKTHIGQLLRSSSTILGRAG